MEGNHSLRRISGNVVDIHSREIFFGTVFIDSGKIARIEQVGPVKQSEPYILPGFVDAHVHIESSMLTPGEFARVAVTHGTVAVVSDPHEIANVLGVEGVEFMLAAARDLPFHISFGAPSCVPATAFERSGAEIGPKELEQLLRLDGIGYLSEMMNYPGVLEKAPVVMQKISIAKELGLPIDGHAPGLSGQDAIKYIEAGISTDHECFTLEEARFKIEHGMKVLIREGSAAKNFEALWPLIEEFPEALMFCSDDKHPDDLVRGHINQLVARAIEKGCDLFDVLRIASINPVAHYHLPVGLLREEDSADFILVQDLDSMQVLATFWKGEKVAENKRPLFEVPLPKLINHFNRAMTKTADYKVPVLPGAAYVRVIEALDGEIVTNSAIEPLRSSNGYLISSDVRDNLFIAVVNRYENKPPAVGLVRGFGLKKGAIASSVAHDSHNIVAVGVSADEINTAVNLLISSKGGVCAVDGTERRHLPLLVAGLMSEQSAGHVAHQYEEVDRFAKEVLGSQLTAPLMTLSFMSLLVIPSLKMSDKGLFDCSTFDFTPLQLSETDARLASQS